MRRLTLMTMLCSAVALLAPGIASARHRHHHSSHVRKHAHHARIVRFGARLSSGANTKAPTAPSSPTTETAGKVTSFTGGVLTITLNDNSVVSGKVTEQTEIHCISASGEQGDDDQGDDDARLASGTTARVADDGGGGDDQGDEDQGDDDGNGASCGPSSLLPETVVLSAELKLGPAGAVWHEIDLLV